MTIQKLHASPMPKRMMPTNKFRMLMFLILSSSSSNHILLRYTS